MSFVFNSDNLVKIEELKKRYPSERALVLPLLWMAQEQDGYISIEAVDVIASICNDAPMEIYRVATFYTMFHMQPIAKHHIQLCKTLSCALCGKAEILEHLKSKLDIEVGGTTKDGNFTLSQVECLGSCGTAPMMQINRNNYENLTVEKIDEILKELT